MRKKRSWERTMEVACAECGKRFDFETEPEAYFGHRSPEKKPSYWCSLRCWRAWEEKNGDLKLFVVRFKEDDYDVQNP